MLREEILKRMANAEKALNTAQLEMGIITGLASTMANEEPNCRYFASLAGQVLTDNTTALKHFHKFKDYAKESFINIKFEELLK